MKGRVDKIQRCFDCPRATFRSKSVTICGEAKQLGLDDKRKVNSQALSPTCPLGYGQNNGEKKRK